MENLSLLALLRQQTAAKHRQVEQQAPISALMSADLDDDGYLDALFVLHDFVASAERSLQHHFGDQSSGTYYYLPRLREIIRDIHQLQGITPTYQPATVEPCFYRAIGMAYVIEGSTAGGKILAKRLARQLRRDRNSGLAYFNFHRRGTWSLFQRWLETVQLNASQRQRCISGAMDGFDTLLAQQHSIYQQQSC
jgi:heme oxygenase